VVRGGAADARSSSPDHNSRVRFAVDSPGRKQRSTGVEEKSNASTTPAKERKSVAASSGTNLNLSTSKQLRFSKAAGIDVQQKQEAVDATLPAALRLIAPRSTPSKGKKGAASTSSGAASASAAASSGIDLTAVKVPWMQVLFNNGSVSPSSGRGVRGVVDALYHVLSQLESGSGGGSSTSLPALGGASPSVNKKKGTSVALSILSAANETLLEGIGIPETVVFRQGVAVAHYWTANAMQGGDVRERHFGRNFTPAKVAARFAPELLYARTSQSSATALEQGATNRPVAALLASIPVDPHGQGEPSYLSHADASAMLLHDPSAIAAALQQGNFVLQQQLVPATPGQQHELLRASWVNVPLGSTGSPSFTLRRRAQTRASFFDQSLPASQRLVGFDGSGSGGAVDEGSGVEDELVQPGDLRVPQYTKLARVATRLASHLSTLSSSFGQRLLHVSFVFQRAVPISAEGQHSHVGRGAAAQPEAQWLLLYADSIKFAEVKGASGQWSEFGPVPAPVDPLAALSLPPIGAAAANMLKPTPSSSPMMTALSLAAGGSGSQRSTAAPSPSFKPLASSSSSSSSISSSPLLSATQTRSRPSSPPLPPVSDVVAAATASLLQGMPPEREEPEKAADVEE
jgi:hypothetical protein